MVLKRTCWWGCTALHVYDALHVHINVVILTIALTLCRHLHRLVSVVPQRPVLFAGSLAGNLDPSGVLPAAKLMQALADVQLLPALRHRAARLAWPSALPAAEGLEHCAARAASAADGLEFASAQRREAGSAATNSVTAEAREDWSAHGSQRLAAAILRQPVTGARHALPLAQQQQLCIARALLQEPACAPTPFYRMGVIGPQ